MRLSWPCARHTLPIEAIVSVFAAQVSVFVCLSILDTWVWSLEKVGVPTRDHKNWYMRESVIVKGERKTKACQTNLRNQYPVLCNRGTTRSSGTYELNLRKSTYVAPFHKADSVFARTWFYVAFIWTHPEVNAHSGDEAAGQESSVFKTDQ